MGDETKSKSRGKWRVVDFVAIAVFVLGLLAWLLAAGPITIIMHEWTVYPKVGDAAIGLIIFGPLVLAVSLLFLLASILLSIFAKRLPVWFRVLTVVSPVLGCFVGLAIIYRAMFC